MNNYIFLEFIEFIEFIYFGKIVKIFNVFILIDVGFTVPSAALVGTGFAHFTDVFSSHSDLLQNATIVPLKMLRGHQRSSDLGVLDVIFPPTQPWLFTAGADCTIRLYT